MGAPSVARRDGRVCHGDDVGDARCATRIAVMDRFLASPDDVKPATLVLEAVA
jgi:hypothetical protein